MQPYFMRHLEGVVKATNLDNKYTGGEFSDTVDFSQKSC